MTHKKNSDAKIRANNRYTEKAYDRINLAVPKGQKERIKRAAEKRGESINGYITRIITDQLSRDQIE